jgi:methanogenic corrinoid protein MtbC1
VTPLLSRIGEGWRAGEVSPGQEHLASDVIDGVLARLADQSRLGDGPGLVVATLPGERHALGARLVAAVASTEGWRVTYLGPDLPAADIAAAADGVGAHAVAISVVGLDRHAETIHSLSALRELLAPTVDILVGGAGARLLDADRLPNGVLVLEGLEPLRELRRALR